MDQQSIWPERPTCHGQQSPVSGHQIEWRPPEPEREPYGEPYRTCSYCGSIHPEDLYNHLQSGQGRLGGSDWKYGWPHKFYVEGIPNPQAGKRVRSGTSYGWKDGQRVEEPLYSTGPDHTTAKWYNEHLLDLSPEAFALLAPLLAMHSGIEFFWEDGQLKYRAPRYGYQR